MKTNYGINRERHRRNNFMNAHENLISVQSKSKMKPLNPVFNYDLKTGNKIESTPNDNYDSSNNTDNEEYSFDETEFLNVDENASRNIGKNIKDSRTFQHISKFIK